jgi:hypothetical protein
MKRPDINEMLDVEQQFWETLCENEYVLIKVKRGSTTDFNLASEILYQGMRHLPLPRDSKDSWQDRILYPGERAYQYSCLTQSADALVETALQYWHPHIMVFSENYGKKLHWQCLRIRDVLRTIALVLWWRMIAWWKNDRCRLHQKGR